MWRDHVHLLVPHNKNLVSSLGFYYAGPIDGHDLSTLVPILRNARDSKHEGPIMIHIKTQKGKGYSYAEKAFSA